MVNEEYEGLREVVRALSEKEIAPYAAEVDELERFPREAQVALTGSPPLPRPAGPSRTPAERSVKTSESSSDRHDVQRQRCEAAGTSDPDRGGPGVLHDRLAVPLNRHGRRPPVCRHRT